MTAGSIAVSIIASLLVGEQGAVVRACKPAVHERAVKDGTALATKMLAAARRGDSHALAALVAERGLTVADGLIPRPELVPAMDSRDTPLHQYLYDTEALRRVVKSVVPVLSLQDFARAAKDVTVDVKTNCAYEKPMAYVHIKAANLGNVVMVSLVWEKGGWRIGCLDDFSC